MCGRFVLADPEAAQKRFQTKNKTGIKPLFNASTGMRLPVVTQNGQCQFELMKWGLVPFWAKEVQIGYKMINARSETVAEKPAYRKAFKSQRCLVPASGFYEWKKTDDAKIPYYIHLKSNDIMAFAGLYDLWENENKEMIKSFTIIGLIHQISLCREVKNLRLILPFYT